MTNFVGVDLHRNNFTYCIRVNGEERKIGKCEITELKGFAAMLGPNTAMAVEATGNTFMFCSSLRAYVGRLVVVNPSQFKVISMSTKKTDKHDAKVLAEFLEKDMLPEVRMKDDLQAKISSLTQTREKLVQLRTVLKNKVNNLLAANFIVLKREELSTEKGLVKALSYRIDLEGYGYPRRALRSGECPTYLFDEIAGLFAVQSPFSMRRLVSLYAELIARMGEGENDASEAGRLVNECVRLIHAGYADRAFNVNRMAAELRVHRTTLDRVFRQKMRLSPIDYLIRFRIQRGLSLLAETSLPVAEIADRVGISQSNYFSRLVRRTVGMTPSEYRLARNL